MNDAGWQGFRCLGTFWGCGRGRAREQGNKALSGRTRLEEAGTPLAPCQCSSVGKCCVCVPERWEQWEQWARWGTSGTTAVKCWTPVLPVVNPPPPANPTPNTPPRTLNHARTLSNVWRRSSLMVLASCARGAQGSTKEVGGLRSRVARPFLVRTMMISRGDREGVLVYTVPGTL